MIGKETTEFYPCLNSSDIKRHLFINCSSWKAGEYITTRDNVRACDINNAQCVRVYNYCVCRCTPGYTSVDDKCLKKMVNIGDRCEQNWQCKGTEFANICDHGLCICNPGYIQIDRTCYRDHSENHGSSNGQHQGTNIGVTLGTLFGVFILSVIVTVVLTTLIYRRLKYPTRKREAPGVISADNRANDAVSGAEIFHTNDKKQKVATVYQYSFLKETPEYKLSGKQENERTEDVYNHLHEQTEQDDDTYDHACAAPNYSTDHSDYSYLRNGASVQPTLQSIDGGDYSTLGQ